MIKGRIALAIGLFLLLLIVAAVGKWYESQRSPQAAADATMVIHVTNAGDRGPGTMREALFLAAGATGPSRISLEVASITLETPLPAFVNGHGVKVIGQAGGVALDAHALGSGPVLDISGDGTSIEGIKIVNCPGTAILVRAAHLRLASSTVQSCDLGVDVAENASGTLLEHNQFVDDRIGVRFAASGRDSSVVSNQFIRDKDAGLWAVRSNPVSHDEAITIRDNKFTENGNAVVAGNIPVLVLKNEFLNNSEAAVHLIGNGGVVRANHISGGASMGIIAENARSALIENNEIEGVAAYGVMVRGSANILVRANRFNNCSYGMAFVLGVPAAPSTAIDNTIIEPKFNGVDVIGDSPNLKRNQVLHPRAFGLHVEDFTAPEKSKVVSKPFLDNNSFGTVAGEGAIPRATAQAAGQ
jgi:parallel beta-helix repeat protein